MFINTFKGIDGETGNGVIFGIVSNSNNTSHPRGLKPVAVYEIDLQENIDFIKNSEHPFYKSNDFEVCLSTLLEEDISNRVGIIKEYIPNYMPRTDCGTPNIYVNIASIKTALHL